MCIVIKVVPDYVTFLCPQLTCHSVAAVLDFLYLVLFHLLFFSVLFSFPAIIVKLFMHVNVVDYFYNSVFKVCEIEIGRGKQ